MAREKRSETLLTGRRVADDIAEGLQEALLIAQGKRKPVRIDRWNSSKPPHYSATEIKTIRGRLGLSQSAFSILLGVTPKAVEAWEAGTHPPSGVSSRALQIFASHPELVGEFLVLEGASKD